jgi:hypothetical protein
MQLKIPSAYMTSYTKTYYFTRTKFFPPLKLIQGVFIHNLTLSSEESAAILLQKDKNVKLYMTLGKITSESFWTVHDNTLLLRRHTTGEEGLSATQN